jgi:hypothetical protein
MSAWPAGLLLLIPSLVLSQTPAKYVGTISVGHRVIDQFAFPYPNCECGIAPDDASPNYQLGAVTTRHIQVSPSAVTTQSGVGFTLTYDATNICRGDTITTPQGTPMAFNQDLKPITSAPDAGWIEVGTIDWGDEVEGLTRTYGILSHKYPDSGPRDILLTIDVGCANYRYSGCPGACKRSVTVPAQVLIPKAKRTSKKEARGPS